MDIQLIHNDCFKVFPYIPNKSIDFVFTDPPYYFRTHQNRGIGTEGKSKFANSDMYKEGNKLSQMGSFKEEDIVRLLNECKRVLKVFKGYFFCNMFQVQYYCNWAIENKYLFTIITLAKPISVINRNRYSTNAEYLIRIYNRAGAGIKVFDYSQEEYDINWLSSVQQFDRIPNRLHITEKPKDIIKGVLTLNTNEGDLVLDPFCGSASIGAVAKGMGRRYLGIELDEKYFNIAKERLEGCPSM